LHNKFECFFLVVFKFSPLTPFPNPTKTASTSVSQKFVFFFLPTSILKEGGGGVPSCICGTFFLFRRMRDTSWRGGFDRLFRPPPVWSNISRSPSLTSPPALIRFLLRLFFFPSDLLLVSPIFFNFPVLPTVTNPRFEVYLHLRVRDTHPDIFLLFAEPPPPAHGTLSRFPPSTFFFSLSIFFR